MHCTQTETEEESIYITAKMSREHSKDCLLSFASTTFIYLIYILTNL